MNVATPSICLCSYGGEMCEYLWIMNTILWLFDLVSDHQENFNKSRF